MRALLGNKNGILHDWKVNNSIATKLRVTSLKNRRKHSLVHDTIKWLNCVVGDLNVKIYWNIGSENYCTVLLCTQISARVEKVDVLGWNKLTTKQRKSKDYTWFNVYKKNYGRTLRHRWTSRGHGSTIIKYHSPLSAGIPHYNRKIKFYFGGFVLVAPMQEGLVGLPKWGQKENLQSLHWTLHIFCRVVGANFEHHNW